MVGKRLRPGMSARNLTSRIIEGSRKKKLDYRWVTYFLTETTGKRIKIKIIAEQIVEMIQTEALVDVAIDIGAIQISSTGTAAGIFPVIAQGCQLTSSWWRWWYSLKNINMENLEDKSTDELKKYFEELNNNHLDLKKRMLNAFDLMKSMEEKGKEVYNILLKRTGT